VNTAIFSPTGGSVGIGFAIPADLADDVSRQLIANGSVTRGYLGVGVSDLSPAVAAQLNLRGQRGALIVEVDRSGPAAGVLRAGDLVVAAGGQEVTGAGGLMRRIASAKPGERLPLQVLREGRKIEVSAVVRRRPDGA
jgi:serine protease Do